MSASSNLYRAARLTRDFEVLASGDPARIRRRIRNRIVGRLLARAGAWKWLWS